MFVCRDFFEMVCEAGESGLLRRRKQSLETTVPPAFGRFSRTYVIRDRHAGSTHLEEGLGGSCGCLPGGLLYNSRSSLRACSSTYSAEPGVPGCTSCRDGIGFP